MDINNINRDRDTSGLGPIEYDQSKVPSLIRKHADNVRTKTYGQEVREAQARNAEVAGLIANEAVGISNNIKGRQDIIESDFNLLQQEITNKDVISAPEIITARNGENTLNDYLDTLAKKDEVTKSLNYSRPVDDAAYNWWINPLAITKDSKTFISSVGSTGKMTITCFDHDTKTMERTEIADYEGDDHNAMSVNFMRDGRVIVMYARHNADSVVRARVSTRPYDITEFGAEVILQSSGGVTYVQSFDSGFDQYLRIIYRTGVYKWGTALFNRDTGKFDTSEKIWLDSGSGQYYVLAMPYADGSRRTRLFMYGHPIIDPLKNHVRYGYIGANSELITVGGVILASLNMEGNLPTTPDQYHLAYTPPTGKKMRLLDVAISTTPKFVFSEFDNGNNSQYKEAVWNGTSFDTSDITESGKAVEVPVGGNFYFGGVSYEKRDDNTIYLAREVNGLWKVEKWVKTDNTWLFNELLDENDDKIFRPYSIFDNTNSMRVSYLKGTYQSYTNYLTSLFVK